jgi:chorismate--pyruvate lyase
MSWLKSPKVLGVELSWLTEEGSLTERLKKEFDDVKVEVVYEGVYLLDKNFYVREVLLKSNNSPKIFARTLVKTEDLQTAWSSLKNLGNQSLATILFNSPDIKKTSVFYKEFFLDNLMFAHINALSPIHKKSLWARRSSWEKQGAYLELVEIFL